MSEGFVDKEKMEQLVAQIEDKLREIGLTVLQISGGFDDEGEILIQSIALVRETAYRQITQDLETREELNRMAAADHQRELDQRAAAIQKAIEGGYLRDVMLGDRELVECSHERIHEGLCLDCSKEVDDGQEQETS
jgi:hypothetical protein